MGGGWTTGNLTGIFARQAGAEGLVYPSARNNSSVVIYNGAVRESTGWCFLRYAGAPAMEIEQAFSQAADSWPTTPGFAPHEGSWVKEFIPLRHTAIHHVTSGEACGSWYVEGLAEYNSAGYRLSQVVSILKALGDELASNVASRLSYMARYSRAEDMSFLAGLLLRNLLGDARSKAELEEMVPKAQSEYERDSLRGVLEVADRVPVDFRITGLLAKAWGFKPS